MGRDVSATAMMYVPKLRSCTSRGCTYQKMEKPVKKKVIVRKRCEAREKGQPYINSRGKEMPAKQPPAEQASCSFHKGFYRSIDVKYLENGHSYMNCDRNFGVIEKKRKAAKAITPKDLEALVASAKLTTPFTVVSMNTDDFIGFKGLAKDYLNTKDLAISKISHFHISHKNPSTVKVASVLGLEGDVMVTWKKVDVLKKNANLDNVPDIHDLPKIHFKSKISREKKNDLLGMIDYIEKEEDKDLYRALLENKTKRPATWRCRKKMRNRTAWRKEVQYCDVMVTWKKVDVLKKNANLDNVPDIHDLPKIHFKSKISREKKNDLLGMIDYIEKEEDKDLYRALLENKTKRPATWRCRKKMRNRTAWRKEVQY
uniref:(California timema) hypothetical protein n=1 Tax=Timema californicum TaxID=61474 RepID=A0A7R9PDD9_TIMCA|nr:unnamed protein product [Timema californicum]